MHKLYVVSFDGRCVWTDMEAESLAVGLDDIEGELTFGFGESFPCLADVIGLFFSSELG